MRRRFRGSPRAQSALFEQINNSFRQRIVGANNCKTDILFFREFREILKIHCTNRHILSERARAAVPRRDEKFPDARRLRKLPRERMLSASSTDNKYISRHVR